MEVLRSSPFKSRGGFVPNPVRRGPSPWSVSSPCPVCECTDVRMDEVDVPGAHARSVRRAGDASNQAQASESSLAGAQAQASLRLLECPRCEHRWTEPSVSAQPQMSRPVSRRRVATPLGIPGDARDEVSVPSEVHRRA